MTKDTLASSSHYYSNPYGAQYTSQRPTNSAHKSKQTLKIPRSKDSIEKSQKNSEENLFRRFDISKTKKRKRKAASFFLKFSKMAILAGTLPLAYLFIKWPRQAGKFLKTPFDQLGTALKKLTNSIKMKKLSALAKLREFSKLFHNPTIKGGKKVNLLFLSKQKELLNTLKRLGLAYQGIIPKISIKGRIRPPKFKLPKMPRIELASIFNNLARFIVPLRRSKQWLKHQSVRFKEITQKIVEKPVNKLHAYEHKIFLAIESFILKLNKSLRFKNPFKEVFKQVSKAFKQGIEQITSAFQNSYEKIQSSVKAPFLFIHENVTQPFISLFQPFLQLANQTKQFFFKKRSGKKKKFTHLLGKFKHVKNNIERASNRFIDLLGKLISYAWKALVDRILKIINFIIPKVTFIQKTSEVLGKMLRQLIKFIGALLYLAYQQASQILLEQIPDQQDDRR